MLDGLGDKFLSDLVGSVVGTRADLADMRAWRPGWFPSMSERCLANLIHDRIWARLVAAIDGQPDVEAIDRAPVREIWVDRRFHIRVKRHHPDDRISSYPTAAALEFWTQGAQIPGMEVTTLGVGYRWDAELRAIGPSVVSYRDGKDNPIWAVELTEPAEGSAPISWRPIVAPSLPDIDLFDASRDDEQDEGRMSP